MYSILTTENIQNRNGERERKIFWKENTILKWGFLIRKTRQCESQTQFSIWNCYAKGNRKSCTVFSYWSLLLLLLLLIAHDVIWKRANKQTNEDGNDRTRCVDMKMKIKFVRNNDFEEETDLNKYIFPFLDIHHSLVNWVNLGTIYFYLSNEFGFRYPMMSKIDLIIIQECEFSSNFSL